MATFDELIYRVLLHEGGYVNHPHDPGGATNFGITERVARRHGYEGRMQDLPRETAIAIYREDYWNPVRGDELPKAVAFQVLDAAVNHGVSRASEWLQQAVGATADGNIGPKTMAAVRDQSPCDTVLKFNAIRLTFYASLNGFTTFGKGWTRRVAGNILFAAGDLP